MELMDHAFTLINTKLAPLHVARNMKNRITDAEYKSQKRIEEEFQQLLDYSFSSLIQFNPSNTDSEY